MDDAFKEYRLRIIADAAEKVRAERESLQKTSDEFSLDEVDYE